MKNSKGFLFTVDAVFSLVVAGVATGILLYVYFSGLNSYTSSANQAQTMLNSLLQSNASSLTNLFTAGRGVPPVYNGDNQFHAMAQMYLTNYSDYATLLLTQLFPSQRAALFVNNAYAPSLEFSQFNGISSYAEQKQGFAFMDNSIQPFTISIWVYPQAPTGTIVDELGQSAPNTGWHDAWINLYKNNIYVNVYTGSLPCLYLATAQLSQWTHIVITGRPSGSSLILSGYVNGAFANSITVTRQVPSPTGSIAMYYAAGVGDSSSCGGSGAFFAGSLENYQVYNAVLSNTVITGLYQQGAAGVPVLNSSLAAWWPLAGNADDLTGNGYSAIATKLSYGYTGYTPSYLNNAHLVSSSSLPVGLSSNGNSIIYNVSVVTWR